MKAEVSLAVMKKDAIELYVSTRSDRMSVLHMSMRSDTTCSTTMAATLMSVPPSTGIADRCSAL